VPRRERAERRVGFDLGGFAQREVGLDGVQHRLVHVAVVLVSDDAELGFQLGRQAQRHKVLGEAANVLGIIRQSSGA